MERSNAAPETALPMNYDAQQINPDPEESVVDSRSQQSSAPECPKPANGAMCNGRGEASTEPNTDQFSAFRVWQKRLIVSLAASVGWFSTSSSFIFFPIIPFLARDLHESTERINLTVTSYLVASGVFPSIVCGLSDVYGRRPVLITAVGSYVLVNVGLAVQRSFGVMLGLRLLQSAAISGTYINLSANWPSLFLCKTTRVLM